MGATLFAEAFAALAAGHGAGAVCPIARWTRRWKRFPAAAMGLSALSVRERTPHMDPLAAACSFGLTLKHSRAHLMRARDGRVVFSLRDCLELYEQLGQSCRRVIASGGGARAPWLTNAGGYLRQRGLYLKCSSRRALAPPSAQASARACTKAGSRPATQSHPLERYAGRSGFKGTARYAEYRGAFPRALPIQPGTDASMHGLSPPGKMKQKPNRFSLSTM